MISRKILVRATLLLVCAASAYLMYSFSTVATAGTSSPKVCHRGFHVDPVWPVSAPMSVGFTLTVKACNTDYIWVFDRDADGGLRMDNKNGAFRPHHGSVAFTNRPIGNAEDPPGTAYSVVTVRANAACSYKLATAKRDKDGVVYFSRSLPKGCPNVNGDTDVRRTTFVKTT